MILRICLTAIIGLALSLTACQKGSSGKPGENSYVKETATSGEIHITVDETFKPILESVIHTFEATYPKAKVHATYLPGEEAIRSMLEHDSIRLAITTRQLEYPERQMLKKQMTTDKVSILARDAVALIVNQDNPVSQIDYKRLEQVLSGEATNWQQLDPAAKLGDIALVFDNESSSTLQFLRDSAYQGLEVSKKAFSAKTNPAVVDYVSKTPGAIGVIGVSWISDSDDNVATGFTEKIKVLKVQNTSKCSYPGTHFQPYQGLIHQNCYPLSRYVYSVLRETKTGLGTGFVAYIAGEQGQRIILKSGLVTAYGIPRIVQFPKK